MVILFNEINFFLEFEYFIPYIFKWICMTVVSTCMIVSWLVVVNTVSFWEFEDFIPIDGTFLNG